MTNDARSQRNRDRLQECNPVFRHQLAILLATMDARGFRPRIQDAWRSEADQLIAFNTGRSHVRWGLHNATTSDGKPDALAADVLDDDHPLAPAREYLLTLCRLARAHGLNTGLDWDLPAMIRAALNAAVAAEQPWEGHIGWDPTHVEITGLTLAQARAGERPRVESA